MDHIAQLTHLFGARPADPGDPRNNTLPPVAGGPAPGPGPRDPHPPGGVTALPRGTIESLESAVWQINEHFSAVRDRVTEWKPCDWHVLDHVVLSATPGADGYQLKGNPLLVTGRAPTRRLTIYNPSQVTLHIGPSQGTALAGSDLIVPAGSVMVVPWNAADVEIAADPSNLDFDIPGVVLVRSDRETDEITCERLGNTAGLSPQGVQLGSNAPLAANGVFVSNAMPGAPQYATARAFAWSDVAGTVFIDQWAAGGWRPTSAGGAALPAGGIGVVAGANTGPWWRVRVVNGAAPQTAFEVQWWSVL